LFYYLTLKVLVHNSLIQCRTGHGYFGDYYRSAVPSESISCPYGEEIQTRKYIIDTCPQYKNYCQILRNVSNSIYMPNILGTKQGIATLSKFLERSGVFTKSGTGLPRWKPPTMEDFLAAEHDMEDPEDD